MELVGLRVRRAKVGRAASLEVGPVSFRNCPVALVEGKVIEGADGVVPLVLFSDFLMRLDLAERTLRLIPYPGEKGTARSSRRMLGEGDFLLVGTLLNRKYRGYVVIDTGAFCSAISREVAGTLSIPPLQQDLRIWGGTGAATGQLVSRVVHFEIAGQDVVPEEIVALDLLNLSRHYGVKVLGVLGFPALRPYVLTIDYHNHMVKIDPKLTVSSRERHQLHRENSRGQLALR
jgi:hypothetical protein